MTSTAVYATPRQGLSYKAVDGLCTRCQLCPRLTVYATPRQGLSCKAIDGLCTSCKLCPRLTRQAHL
jgi:hypothetical protein